MTFKTDYKAVHGLGSAKEGTGHFISQRLTAIALIFLGPAFLIPFMQNLGGDHADVLTTYQHPFHALVAIGFFLVMFRHLRLGLQVVIEDYIHGERLRMACMIFNALAWRAFAVAGAFAIVKIALGA